MTKIYLIIGLLLSQALAFADTPTDTTDFNFGPSVPVTDTTYNVDPADANKINMSITRITGGDIISIKFGQNGASVANPISGVRLIGYSKSGKGSILVHNVSSKPAAAFDPLVIFSSIENGAKAENYDGLVMLANEDSVAVNLADNPSLTELDLQVEAFGDDDASLVVQFTAPALLQGGYTINWAVVNPPAEGGGGDGGGGGVSPGPTGNGGGGVSTCTDWTPEGTCGGYVNGAGQTSTCISYDPEGNCTTWLND